MIPAITEINFPSYATLHQATVSLSEMGDRVITTQVRIDGDVIPDFSGWELSFKGERFVLNTKEPQAVKDNSTRNSLVDLTFESWVARELKRYFFFEAASVNASTAIADKYKASVNLAIEDFVVLYNKVLDHYFGGSVVMSLYMSGQGQYSTDRALMEIDYSYLWDVLVKFYEVYGVRWTIEYNSTSGVYTIKVGYPPESIDDHIFEYGFAGGLLKFERQVQDVDIHNILLGRGGEKNIPYRYFKRTDPQNPGWTADPDAIPELSNIYFDRLRDINFRWYVRGWMQNPHRDTSWEDGGYVYPTYSDIPEEYAWAYERGRTDEKFNPVEYVKDDESIAEYGERWGALDDNDDIYPTIQGVTREPLGRIDETVAVSEIVTDDIEAMSRSASIETSINEIRVALQADTETRFERLSEEFTIPAGSVGDITYVPFGDDTANPGLVRFDTENSTVVATAGGVDYPISGIPAGTYRLKLNMVIRRDSPATSATGTFGIQNIILTTSAMDADAWKPTFDIWVKNIWGTQQGESESDEEYAERVWLPILGDRVGNEAKLVFSTGFMSVSEDYEFTIASYPVHDTSKSINGVPSEWRITLRKSDAEFDVTGLYLPNATTGGQPIAGDKFFFVGIDMPFYYVQLAEEDLNTYKSSELDTSATINPTWIITLDKVRANTLLDNEIGDVLADRITAGTKLKITDPRFTPGKILTLYAQSVTFSWQEPSNESPYIVPDIEVVLSDKVVATEGVIDKIQNDVSYVKNQYARISDVEAVVRSVGEPLFLKKTGESDSSDSPTQFSSKVTSKGFRQGSVGGTGWGIYRDNTEAFRQQATRAVGVQEDEPEGDAVIEADRIVVRKELQVNSLVINQIAYVGGKEIISAAKIEVTKVIETNDGYICYFDQRRNSVANNFVVNDIAYGQVFNPDNTQLRYYKMVVSATDIDSITLSKSGRDGAGAPEVGDIIVQYGNTTNSDRQYVIVRDVIGGGYERMISNLNSVSASGKEYYFAGRQGTSGPRWFVGDSLGDYAEYVNGVLTIKANVIFKAGQVIPGISDLQDELDDLSDDIDTLDYLKTALPESSTIVSGGLILSKVIALRDANNVVKSGLNGDPSLSSIAAWYGGPMADKEATPTPQSYAQSLFRFDGSGYLAGGKITWGANGAGSIPGVSWSADGNSIVINGDVKLASSSGDTVTTLLTAIQNLPNTYVDFTSAQTISGFKTFTSGIKIGNATLTWVEGSNGNPGYLKVSEALLTLGDQIVIGGTPGGGGGGVTSLYLLDDVSVSSRTNGDLLQYNGTVWVNTNPRQLPVATANANGLMSSSDFSKLSGIAANATRVVESTVSGWGFTKNAGTVTSVKVGSTSYNPTSGVVSLPDYLKLTGGTISSTSVYSLYLNNSTSGATAVGIRFQIGGTTVGAIYCTSGGELWNADNKKFYHSGNSNVSTVDWTTKALNVNGRLYMKGGNLIEFDNASGETRGLLSANDSNNLLWYDGSWRTVYHTGNLTKSVLTGLLEGSNGYYVKKSGDEMSGALIFARNIGVYGKDSGENARLLLYLNTNNHLVIGNGMKDVQAGGNTYLRGIELHIQTAARAGTYGDRVIVNSSGNVTVGASDLADTSYKLYVNGAAKVTGQFYLGTSSVSSFNFVRGSANYFTAPADGYFAFVPNGLTSGISNSPLVITAGSIYPGAETDLGRSSSYWHYAYVNRVYLANGAYLEYNSQNGYIYISKPIVTEGDQIVVSGTPGGGGGGGSTTLAGLDDVAVSNPGNGQALVYNTSEGKWKNTTLAISSISGLQAALDSKQASGNYVTSVKVGSTSYAPSSGVVSLPAYPTSLPASDVYAWAKAATKPSYTLDEVADGSSRKLSNYLYGTVNKNIIIRATDNSNTWGAIGYTDGENTAYNLRVIRFGGSPGASFGGSLSAYGSGIMFGGADTRAYMMVRYASGHVEFGGGSVASSTAASIAPSWHFGINGTDGITYDLPTIASNAVNGNTAYNSLGNYLLKTGGTISNSAVYSLYLNNSTANAVAVGLRFQIGGTTVGALYCTAAGELWNADNKKIYHTGNFLAGTDYVSISGTETISGAKTFTGGLYLKFANPRVIFQAADGTVHGNIAARTAGVLEFYDLSAYRLVYHAGNSNKSDVSWSCSQLNAASIIDINRNSGTGAIYDATKQALEIETYASDIKFKMYNTSGTSIGSALCFYNSSNNINVGIGTHTPGYKLDVAGVARCRYMYFLDTAGTGNAGYVGRGGSSNNNLQFTAASGNSLGLGANGSDNIIFINTSGNVGIGVASPTYNLHVSGTTGFAAGHIYLTGANASSSAGNTTQIVFGTSSNNHVCLTSNTGAFILNPTTASTTGQVVIRVGSGTTSTFPGIIQSSGDQVVSSDATLKTNFGKINYSVADIAACRAVTFDWRDGRGRSAGSIAQDWKPLIPELVHGEEGNMTLAYGQIALVNTIILARHETEQDKEIERLKARVAELEDMVYSLKLI